MSDSVVGVRELKTHLSRYLEGLRHGATVTITLRGRPVARLVPIQPTIEDRMGGLAEAGLLAWNGRRLPEATSRAQLVGEVTVAELLLEDRG